MTAFSELEPHVARCVQQFIQRLREVSDGGSRSVNMSAWPHWFTFDVLGEVHFSRNLGFMRTGTDVDNNIALIDAVSQYGSLVRVYFTLFSRDCYPLLGTLLSRKGAFA